MKVWLINPFSDLPNEGASEGRFACLARILAKAGHEVTWWSADFHHRKKLTRQWTASDAASVPYELCLLAVRPYFKNISFARIKSHGDYGESFACESAKLLSENPNAVPDVIHFSSPPLDCIQPILDLKQLYRMRVTVDLMDLWPETFSRTIPGSKPIRSLLSGLLFRQMFRLAQLAHRHCDGISAVSAEYFDVVRKVRQEASAGKDLFLCYVGGNLVEARERSTANSPVRFFYIGAMTPTYDLDCVINAAAKLQAQNQDFEVWFAGGGVSEEALQGKTERLGLTEQVKFFGFLNEEELRERLSVADVGLNAITPGAFITMPHKLSDYLCAGLAVINSIRGESEELLDQYCAGTSYVAGDADSLASVMQSYIANRDELEQVKSAARVLAKERFDRNKTYREFCDWIVGGSPTD